MPKQQTVMVTGGAGYIGSHVAKALIDRHDRAIVVDNLSTGRRDRLDAPIAQLNVSDPSNIGQLEELLIDEGVSGVVHFAALKRVDESLSKPLEYWHENLGGLHNVLQATVNTGVKNFVFSSSAAVYGPTTAARVTEQTPTNPINPYGETKLAGEWLVKAVASSADLRAISLRYFNVVGANEPRLSDTFPYNLFGQTFQRMASGASPVIFGDNYSTPDGSCVRDYVHVQDLAAAHLAALDALESGADLKPVYNIGTGSGYSVKEMLVAILEATGAPFAPEVRPPRPGDPASVVADPTAAKIDLGWAAQHSLSDMVQSAWHGWRLTHNS